MLSAAALILAVVLGEAAAQASDFDAAIYRTRRGPDLTLVDGVLEFDPGIVEEGVDCAYVVNLRVADSAQAPILNDSWRGVLDCGPQKARRAEMAK